MAQHQKTCTILMILVVTMAAGAKAQSSGCTSVLISMSPCLNYISGNTSTPSSGCCTQLASVVRSQPQCLCQVLNGGGSSLGININQTQALELPKACNVQTPPTSQCNGNDPNINLASFSFKLLNKMIYKGFINYKHIINRKFFLFYLVIN
ncbi:putative plant non-specific lipid-transfer protein/Par allergen [Helianthus annuus]|nr:putative plant non-specific lipid-transfer protein/Par allergen [Helianthus annuus]